MNSFVDAKCLLFIQNEFEREGVRGVLANREMRRIQSISEIDSLTTTISELQPDVVIAGARDHPDWPIDVIEMIREENQSCKIILLCDPSSI